MRSAITLLAGLAVLLLLFSCGGSDKSETQAEQTEAMTEQEGHGAGGEMAADMAVDPVCDMKVKKDESAITYEHEGETYYFCTEAHKEDFVANPQKYMAAMQEHQH